jgi:type IV secretory pathway VirB2 component (pilin)
MVVHTYRTTGAFYALWSHVKKESSLRLIVLSAALLLCFAFPGLAAGTNPWEDAVAALQTSFTGPIAKGISLVAIVVGGLMFAFGEGGSKKMLSGIIFGLGMALGAVNFMSWLFPNAG